MGLPLVLSLVTQGAARSQTSGRADEFEEEDTEGADGRGPGPAGVGVGLVVLEGCCGGLERVLAGRFGGVVLE